MSTEYGSGTVGGVGFGNKTSADPSTEGHEDTRFGTHKNADPYSGATEYGSGATGGPGFGNKTSGAGSETIDNSDTRFGTHLDSAPYSGATEHGSGSTGGPGFGNKTSAGYGTDSTSGKIMEKIGHMTHNEGLVEKGHAKREAAGAFEESS